MSYSDDNSFEKILDRCLANDRLINVDKRVGSIIYDALAPVCMELAEAYVKMDILESNTYLLTAVGPNLDKRTYDYGITRKAATYAKRIAEFKKYKTDSEGNYVKDADGNRILVDMSVPEGMRFAVPNDTNTFIYVGNTDGHEVVQCEQPGSKGNTHVGQILPLTPLASLVEAKITGTLVPAEDTETDYDLRVRTLQRLNNVTYGGNIPDYIEKVNAIEGVGNTKVFPAWQYNGSVLLSIVDAQYNPATKEFIKLVKEEIDPEESTGQGVGIAPIGHYVTVGTPTKFFVNVRLSVDANRPLEAIQEDVEAVIQSYIDSERRKFEQNIAFVIYRAKIISAVMGVPSIVNVKDVWLNGEDADIRLEDNRIGITLNEDRSINGHYLPYMGDVTIE